MPPISHFALNQWCNPMFLAITTTGQRIYFRVASRQEALLVAATLRATLAPLHYCAALAA